MSVRIHLALAFILFLLQSAIGQGCSDAGFCTMGAMKPNQNFVKHGDIKLRTLDLQQYLGRTRFNDFIHVSNAEINALAFQKYNIQFKVPYYYITGPLGTNNGIGDLSLSATRALIERENYIVNFTLGAKIPTNHANATQNNAPLPMYYQTSLGTFDFVTGISLNRKGWLLATGYQQVVYNTNENTFAWAPWKPLGLFETAQQYHSSIALKRGSDLMFRIEKNFNYSKFNFYFGLLDVWRLNEDSSLDPKTKNRKAVVDTIGTSKGHALTFLTGFGYTISVKSQLKLMAGQRLIKRHINTDGLSRENVFTLAYQYRF
jgi:hypothetical protein